MSKRELLFSITSKDMRMDTFRAGGPGGQNQNKRDTAVRFVHGPSGAVGESRQYRTQEKNKVAAFRRLVSTKAFREWHRVEVSRRMGSLSLAESIVERLMAPRNIRVEVREGGRWVDVREA